MTNLVVIQEEALSSIVASAVEVALAKVLQPKEKTEYLTRHQVADTYKVSLPTVHAYINKGLLTAQKIGGRTLFERKEVEDALTKKYVYKYKHTK